MSRQIQVSIVVAVKNAAATLGRLLDSVAVQDYPNRELVVMDGGSTDGGLDILNARKAELAYLESSADQGVYHAWNKALDHVQGQWVCFIGADDVLHASDVLSRMVPHLERAAAENVGYVYGDVRILGRTGRLVQTGNPAPDLVARKARRGLFIRHTGSFHHRSLFQGRRFDERYAICADMDFLWPEFIAGRARHVPGLVVADIRLGGLSSRLENAFPVMCETLQVIMRRRLAMVPVAYLLKMALLGSFLVISRPLGEERATRLGDRARALLGLGPRYSI